MKLSLFAVAILSVSLSSCCSTEYLVQDLSGKIPPPLRELDEGELDTVSDETYKRIVRAEKRLGTLRGIILSTQPED